MKDDLYNGGSDAFSACRGLLRLIAHPKCLIGLGDVEAKPQMANRRMEMKKVRELLIVRIEIKQPTIRLLRSLVPIILLSGLVCFLPTQVDANRIVRKLDWYNDRSYGEIISDGKSTSYPDQLINHGVSGNLGSWSTDFSEKIIRQNGQEEVLTTHTILDGNWNIDYIKDSEYPNFRGGDAKFQMTYGDYYASSRFDITGLHCNWDSCTDYIFKPNADAIDKHEATKLKVGETVEISLYTWTKNCLHKETCAITSSKTLTITIKKAVPNEVNFAWLPGSDGTIHSNLESNSYRHQVGHITQSAPTSSSSFQVKVLESKNNELIAETCLQDPTQLTRTTITQENYPMFTGTQVHTFGDGSGFFTCGLSNDSKRGSVIEYGQWYIRETPNGASAGSRCLSYATCYHVLFVPDAASINRDLMRGDSVLSTLSSRNLDIATNPARSFTTETETLIPVSIIVHKESPTPMDPNGKACHEISKPSTNPTPNTQAYWATEQDDLDTYYPVGGHFDLEMGFKEPVRQSTRFYYGVYDIEGDPENVTLYEEPTAGSTSKNIRIRSPNDGGYYQYRVLPTSLTGDEVWYDVVANCQLGAWWTSASRPGVALSIEKDVIYEGGTFRVTATATPQPDRDILVPLYFSDGSRLKLPLSQQIIIRSGQDSGYVDVATSIITGDQSADDVTVSTEWLDSYWLDDSVKSDAITIIDTFPATGSGEIKVRWLADAEFDDNNDPVASGTVSEAVFPDIMGFMETDFNQILSGGQPTSLNKWRFSLYEDTTPDTDADVPPIDEAIHNNPNPKWNVEIETSGVEEVTELEGTETKVGDSAGYGSWYIREDDGYEGVNYFAHTSTRQFLFRPNPDALSNMEVGSSVRSYLRIQKGWCNVINFPRNRECSLHTSRFDGAIDSALIIAVTISVTEDPTPTLSFSMDSYSVAEPATATANATITVTISPTLEAGKTVDVFYETVELAEADTQSDEDPAKSGSDYTAAGVTAGTDKITFAEGETSKDISIPILSDPNKERDEVFQVNLLQPAVVSGETIAVLQDDANTISTKVTITDDPTDGEPEFVLNNVSVDENVGIYNFPLNLSGTTYETVMIDYELLTTGNATTGTDATNGDFMLESGNNTGSVTIAMGTIGSTLPITIFDDTERESSETIVIKFHNPDNAILPNSAMEKEVTITIDDNDGEPTISVDTSPLQEGDPNSKITVNLVPPATTDDISVDYVISAGANGTATEGANGDFIRKTGTLMFDNDDATTSVFSDRAEIPLTINNDSNYEQAETFEIALSNLQGTNVQLTDGQSSVTSTITINEEAGELKPELSLPASIEVWEDALNKTVTIPVTLSGTSYETITVQVDTSSSGATAVAGVDYNAHSGITVTIPPGTTTYEIELADTIIDNQAAGGDKTFKVILSNAANIRTAQTSATLETTVTIKDDESAATLNFAAGTAVSVEEDVGSLVVQVASSQVVSPTEDVTVSYRIPSGGTATAGTDFVIPTETSFEIEFGKKVGEFSIPILSDTDAGEGDEKFKIIMEKPQSLSTSNNMRLKGGADAIELEVTIRDVETSTPTLSLKVDANNEIVVSDTVPNSLLTVTVLLSSAANVTVNYRTEDVPGEAVAGTDYTAASGSLEIKDGATEGTFDVSIADISGVVEKTFNVIIDTTDAGVRLQGGGNATVPDGNGGERAALSRKVKIINADRAPPPTITVTGPTEPVTEAQGANLTYTFSLSRTTQADVTIAYSVSSDSTAEDADYLLRNASPLIITAGETAVSLVITIMNDSKYEGDETIILKLAATNAVFSADTQTHTLTGTIADDEELPVLSIKDAPQSIPEGTAATIRVKSSVQPEGMLSVGYTATDQVGQFLDLTTSDPNPKSMTFKQEGSEFIGELTIGTSKNNRVGEDSGEISVTLDPPQSGVGYDIDNLAASATFAVTDDTDYMILINNKNLFVVEGEDIVVTFEAKPVPVTDFDVRLRVTQNGDNLIWPVRSKVRFGKGIQTATLKLNTVDNPDSRVSGRVSIAIVEGEGYTASAPVSVEVRKPALNTNTTTTKYSVVSSVITKILQAIPPTPPQGESSDDKPTLSIKAVKGTVEEGEPAVFAVSASDSISSDYHVKIALGQSGDFIVGSLVRTALLAEEQLETELIVDSVDDDLAEKDGRITATIQRGSEYSVGSENTAHVIVSDALDRQQRKSRVTSALQEALPNLLADTTAGTFEIAKERMTQALHGNTVSSIKLNNRSSAVGFLESGGEMLNRGSIDWQELIDGSSFSASLNPEAGETSSATIWGIGSQRHLSSTRISELQSWTGETHSGHFGFDTTVGQGMLAGLALSVLQSEIEYGLSGESGMSLDSLTTGIHPYLGISTDTNSQLQILAGYGINEFKLAEAEYQTDYLTGDYTMIGLIGSTHLYSSNTLLTGGTSELYATGQSWFARQSVKPTEEFIDDLQVSARHVRIAIEGSHDHYLTGGGILSPSVLIGLREEGRNENSVAGIDFASELSLKAYNGLELTGAGEAKSLGLNRIYNWKIQSSVDYDAGYDGKGVQVKMSPSWAGTDSDAERFVWGSELVNDSVDSLSFGNGTEIEIEVGYGFEIPDGAGVTTPFFAFEQTDSHQSEFQVGTRFTTNNGIDVELDTVRRGAESGITDYTVNISGSINW